MNLRIVARVTLGSLLVVLALLWLADRLWPLPLPKDDLARVVLATLSSTPGLMPTRPEEEGERNTSVSVPGMT